MVKGISRQVIVVQNPDPELFEQAIFILKEDARPVTDEALLKEADKLSFSYFNVDGFNVVFTKRMIYLCRDGEICERYWRSSLDESPMRLLNKMKKDGMSCHLFFVRKL